MVCTRADDAHRNEVPTPPPAGQAGTPNRSLVRELARWLGQATSLLRGHGGPIEEVIGRGRHGLRCCRGDNAASEALRATISPPHKQTRRGCAPAGEDHRESQALIE